VVQRDKELKTVPTTQLPNQPRFISVDNTDMAFYSEFDENGDELEELDELYGLDGWGD